MISPTPRLCKGVTRRLGAGGRGARAAPSAVSARQERGVRHPFFSRYLGAQRADHAAAVVDRRRLDAGNVGQLGNHPVDHPAALLDVGQLAPRKTTVTTTLHL